MSHKSGVMDFNVKNTGKPYIVPGFQGVMDLDLTRVDKKHHEELVKQHIKDIDDYKLEQATMKPRLRYENTILKAMRIHKIEEDALKLRSAQEKERIARQDKDRYERYQRTVMLKELTGVSENISK